MRFKTTLVLVPLVFGFCQTMSVPAQEIEKPAAEEVSGDIDWLFDYDQGKLESRRTNKPMFVVFRCER